MKFLLIGILLITIPVITIDEDGFSLSDSITAGELFWLEYYFDVSGNYYVKLSLLNSKTVINIPQHNNIFAEMISANNSIIAPNGVFGDYTLQLELLEFNDGFDPNLSPSTGEIIDNLISSTEYSKNIFIDLYQISSLGTGYHIITWFGADAHPAIAFQGINYNYIFWWDSVAQNYIHYSRVTGFGELQQLQTDMVYSYYEF